MKNNNNPSFFALLKNYAFPLWRGLLVAVIISLIATIFTSIQPLLVSGLLEFVIGSNFLVESEVVEPSIGFQSFFDLNTIGVRVKEFFQSYSNSENNNFELVIITLMFFLVIAFLASLFNYFSQIASNWLRVESSRLIRKDIARHLLSLNLAFFHNQKSGEIVSSNLDQQLISDGYNIKRVINYRANQIEKYDQDLIEKLKLKMPDIVYVYSQNSSINFLKLIKDYQLEALWMNTNLMCLGEKTSSILNEIKWKKIFLFNPGEEEFLLYKI